MQWHCHSLISHKSDGGWLQIAYCPSIALIRSDRVRFPFFRHWAGSPPPPPCQRDILRSVAKDRFSWFHLFVLHKSCTGLTLLVVCHLAWNTRYPIWHSRVSTKKYTNTKLLVSLMIYNDFNMHSPSPGFISNYLSNVIFAARRPYIINIMS